MATFHPTLAHLDEQSEPVIGTASLVATALAALGDDWTVYVRPRVGLDTPDFVVVHERAGVVVIDAVDAIDRRANVATGSSSGRLLAPPVDAARSAGRGGDEPDMWRPPVGRAEPVSAAGGPVALALAAARRRRTAIYDHFFAFPGDPREPGAAIRAVVVVSGCSDDGDAAGHVDGVTPAETWRVEDLDAHVSRLGASAHGTAAADPPAPASLERLRADLVVAGIAPSSTDPVRLSPNAQLVAANPGRSAIRGITGPAGGGKSFALTARAARLAAEGKDVLVLCFNLTLANRLRLLVAERCAEYGAAPSRVTCTSFHSFCARVVDDAISAGLPVTEPTRGTWPVKVVARTVHAFQLGFDRRFDAVLVDEGQDFTLAWWNLLRHHVVRPGGEMLLASDPMVDLGGKQTWADPDTLRAGGFEEPWVEMPHAYRMAPQLIESTNEFARTHLADTATTLPTCADDQEQVVGNLAASGRAWRNVVRVSDLGLEMGRQVIRLLRDNPTLRPRDVVYLSEYHHDGLAAAGVIEAAGYPVHHVYSRDPDARHQRKARFWPGADAVKGCTVHSFKGWEAPAVVLGIGVEERSRRLAYASMTRVSSTQGTDRAFLVVVNADPRLAAFQPTFELGAPLSSLR